MSRRSSNVQAIERYVCVLQPKLELQTGGMINLEALDRPESNPPMTDDALTLIIKNRHAASKLEPIFEDMGLNFSNDEPFFLLVVLNLAGRRNGDPGAVRRWRAGETENDRLLLKAYERALNYVADELERRHPGIELRVYTDPKDEPVESKRADSERERRWGTEHSYRLIAEEVERVMKEESCGLEAAKGLVAQRENKILGTPCSFPRVDLAWRFAQKEKRESA